MKEWVGEGPSSLGADAYEATRGNLTLAPLSGHDFWGFLF